MPQTTEEKYILRNILKHTPPSSSNPKVSFEDYCPLGRIRMSGIRLLEWEGEEWNAYTKDGVEWIGDNLNDDDFRALNDSLLDQIKKISTV